MCMQRMLNACACNACAKHAQRMCKAVVLSNTIFFLVHVYCLTDTIFLYCMTIFFALGKDMIAHHTTVAQLIVNAWPVSQKKYLINIAQIPFV